MLTIVQDVLAGARAFERDAHRILARHEAAISRVITVEDTFERLTTLSLKQDQLFLESIRCIENQHFRAAHVMAWAGFMDYLENKMVDEYLSDIQTERPNWSINTVDDMREQATDFELITTGRRVKFLGKSQEKAFKGLLNTRNECAHPSDYSPNLNETLGFVSQLLNRIGTVGNKSHP